MQKNSDSTSIIKNHKLGQTAGLISALEIGLGSLLHSFKVPFTGQFLSLNQGFILSKTVHELKNEREAKISPAIISNTVAILKSLSPAGKKLTPMLAISMQGQLFSLGVILLGNNPLGLILGMWLLCLWAFIQPLLIYMLIYGEDLFFMAQYFLNKLSKVFSVSMENLFLVLSSVVFFKIFLGTMLVFISIKLGKTQYENYQNWLLKWNKKKQATKNTQKSIFYLVIVKDLLSPLFVMSILMAFFFFRFAHSSYSIAFWKLLRPLAIAFILFYLIRRIPVENISIFLKKYHFHRLADSLTQAISFLKKI
jgi:hypothetical protein